MQKTFYMWKIRKVKHRRHVAVLAKPFHILRVFSRVRSLLGLWFDSNAMPMLRKGFRKLHNYKEHCESCFKAVQKLQQDRLSRFVLKSMQQIRVSQALYYRKSLRRVYLRCFVCPLVKKKHERSSACRRQWRRWAGRRVAVSASRKDSADCEDFYDRRGLRVCLNKMSLYGYAIGYQNACMRKATAASHLIKLLRGMQHWQLFQTSRSFMRITERTNYYAIMSFWKFSRAVKLLETQRSLIGVADKFCDEFSCKKCLKVWYQRAKRSQMMRKKLSMAKTFHRQRNKSFAFLMLSSNSQ